MFEPLFEPLFETSGHSGLILIVDDTPANLRVISEVLSDAGFETAIATTGERALELVKREPPDLILLDIMMPGMDGFEICCRLKMQRESQEIPIIFMTALADTDSKVKGLELGAVDYITKPFQEQEVLARVKSHLNLRKTQIQLRYNAEHDNLTHLANRAYFMKWLEKLLQKPRERRSDQFALLFIDLDRFKGINECLGHTVGDQVLVAVSKILKNSIRPNDLIARLGGDEFSIVLRAISQVEDAILVSERIQKAFRQPIVIDEKSLNVSASIGIVADSSHYRSAEEMLRDADIAMYQAKNLGKSCHQLFSPEMYQAVIKKLTLENELRAGLEKKEFYLAYQPIRNLKTGYLAGFEALVRWEHPQRGCVSPGEFIPLAEETGMIIELGRFILREACQQMKQWGQVVPKLDELTISVNLSGRQLQTPDFLEIFDSILSETNLSSSKLKLEMTESVMMENSELTLHLFEALQHRGLRLSLDDFGTGYSSLSYLHRFPIHTLKVDRSFVQMMEPGHSSFEIVRAIIALAQTLKMDVVAEGIETKQQAEYLKTLGCEMGQGYLFAPPLKPEAATQYLHQEVLHREFLRAEGLRSSAENGGNGSSDDGQFSGLNHVGRHGVDQAAKGP